MDEAVTAEGFDRRRPEGAAMPMRYGLFLVAFAACFSIVTPARADTQFGVQAIVLSGTHYQPKGDVSGTGTGALIRFDERWRSVQLHLEGFPSVGTATVDTPSGPVKASIGLFAASARFRIDRSGNLWAGIGTEVLAQQTPQLGLGKIDASRLAGTRYEIFSELSIKSRHFVETQIAVMPHLSGIVYETRTAPSSIFRSGNRDETASMVDIATSYGIRSKSFDYLVGVHMLNFAATFASGREADRNVGAGLTAEIRAHF
jgi:hypothetical protein